MSRMSECIFRVFLISIFFGDIVSCCITYIDVVFSPHRDGQGRRRWVAMRPWITCSERCQPWLYCWGENWSFFVFKLFIHLCFVSAPFQFRFLKSPLCTGFSGEQWNGPRRKFMVSMGLPLVRLRCLFSHKKIWTIGSTEGKLINFLFIFLRRYRGRLTLREIDARHEWGKKSGVSVGTRTRWRVVFRCHHVCGLKDRLCPD